MVLKCGIIGLPNVGKSTLFNALTSSSKADVDNYPFCTINPNYGIIKVPDKKLELLASILKPQSVLYTTIQFVDIAGLVKGASKGEGLGNQFLNYIRNVDVLIHVVRCFENINITHIENNIINPVRDVDIINTEMILADIEIINKNIKILQNILKNQNNDCLLISKIKVLEQLKFMLNRELLLDNVLNINQKYQNFIKELKLITTKNIIYVANIDEDNLNKVNSHVFSLKKYLGTKKTNLITSCLTLEAEISKIEDSKDRKFFFQEIGFKKFSLENLIILSYNLLNYITFYTTVNKKLQAWTVLKDTKVIKAAGKIHSDIEKGFICAEILTFNNFIKSGSFSKAKENGLVRLEGKNYIIQEGDLIKFRFNI